MRKNLTMCLLLIFTVTLLTIPVSAKGNPYTESKVGLSSIITPRTADTYIVTTDGLRLRSEPGLSGTIIGHLNTGDQCECASDTTFKDGYDRRYVVSSPAGSGWVTDMYLKVAPS